MSKEVGWSFNIYFKTIQYHTHFIPKFHSGVVFHSISLVLQHGSGNTQYSDLFLFIRNPAKTMNIIVCYQTLMLELQKCLGLAVPDYLDPTFCVGSQSGLNWLNKLSWPPRNKMLGTNPDIC